MNGISQRQKGVILYPANIILISINSGFIQTAKTAIGILSGLMEHADPSFGYHPLARLLTDEYNNNLVITTNFDSLVEDALFLYTDQKPLTINHELTADYIGDHSIEDRS